MWRLRGSASNGGATVLVMVGGAVRCWAQPNFTRYERSNRRTEPSKGLETLAFSQAQTRGR